VKTERMGKESLILTSYHFNFVISSNRYNSNAKVGRSVLKAIKTRRGQLCVDLLSTKERHKAEDGCKDNEEYLRTTTD
jgi:hypothetical protein